MDEVYKYICGCGHWWATENEDRHCPKCGGDELVSRVYLESEEAAMLTALGALTFERDEARAVAAEWYQAWCKMRNLRARDVGEARALARKYYQLWRDMPKPPFEPRLQDIAEAMEKAAEETAARVTGKSVVSKRSKGGKK